MVILGDHNIIKISFGNFNFGAVHGEKVCKQVVHGPHSQGHYWWKQSFRVFGTGFDRPSAKLQTAKKTSFRILVGIYCHNITTLTPQSGYHGVTEVAKTANIARMAEKCINYISARPTPPHTNPMESGPGNTFSAQNRKKPKDTIAFGKSTSQRIYPKQQTPKIGWKLHKYGLKHALHILDGHFR